MEPLRAMSAPYLAIGDKKWQESQFFMADVKENV